MTPPKSVPVQLKALHLPTAARLFPEIVARAQRDNWPLEAFAAELLEAELEGRRQSRVERLTRAAHLPPGKTLATLDQATRPACRCGSGGSCPDCVPATSPTAPTTC